MLIVLRWALLPILLALGAGVEVGGISLMQEQDGPLKFFGILLSWVAVWLLIVAAGVWDLSYLFGRLS